MNSEELLYAMKGIDDDIISKTYRYSAKKKIVSFRKRLIIAACICLTMLATGIISYTSGFLNKAFLDKGDGNQQTQLAKDFSNCFTLKVCAAENQEIALEAGKSIPLSIGNTGRCWGFSGGDVYDENDEIIGSAIYYCFDLPIMDCDGENIKDITFSINKSKLRVVNHVVNADGTVGDGTCDDYDSYTFSYDEFKNNKIIISITGSIPDNDENTKNIFEPQTVDEYLNKVQEILDGTIVTCQVTYDDGSTDSIDIGVSAEYLTYDKLKEDYGIEFGDIYEDGIWKDGAVEIFYKIEE